ncbi:MAG: hypothetical protein ABIW33_01760 [Sphingomicrobium sp.]
MRASQPALAAIKLAWWRERLEELDDGLVPAEPRLAAVARELLPKGIAGAELAQIEAGWAALLHETPDTDAALFRGEMLFALASRLLQPAASSAVTGAGRLYAGASLVRRALLKTAPIETATGARIPVRFRPLTALAALGIRDLRGKEPEGTPMRALALVRHRLSGRL